MHPLYIVISLAGVGIGALCSLIAYYIGVEIGIRIGMGEE